MNGKTANRILLITGILVLGMLSGCGPGVTPTPTPEPTPTPHPLEIANAFGIVWASSFQPEGWDVNTWPTQRAADAGARWDRWPLEWSRVEPSPGQFVWSGAAHNYDIAVSKDRGTSPPLNILVILGNTPEWFNPASLDEPAFLDPEKTQPNSANQWGYFVYQASTRYHSTKNSAIAWKIGNEPPAKTFTGVSVEDYVKFISVACEVLETMDPNGLVVLGAPEHVPGVNAVGGVDNWYRQMILELVRKEVYSCIDAITFHAYGGAQHTEYLAVGGYDLWKSLTKQEKDVPVWMTETGVAHADQEWCGWEGYPPCADEEETADYIIQNYVWMLQGAARRGYEGKVFHHHFRDTNSPDPRDGVHLMVDWTHNWDTPRYVICERPTNGYSWRCGRKRFWIEPTFRDWKSYGFDLETSQIRDHQRLNCLVLGMAIATLWLIHLGHWAIATGRDRRLVAKHRPDDYSIFRLGRDYAQRCQIRSWRLPVRLHR